ncbi:MAG: UbiD family decarboxylase [Chloroflexi bacterium]|nr:MAG: UbiD family decarboxylase [Chloroflexota bacterium]
MAYRNLDEFLIRLEQAKERIPNTSPIVTNLFNTERRIAWALNLENLNMLTQKVHDLISPEMSFSGLMSQAGALMAMFRQFNSPKPAAVQRHNTPANISVLPQYRRGAHDSHNSLPFAYLITPTAKRYVHEIIIHNTHTLGIQPIVHLTEKTPAAVVIGGDPAVMWSVYTPLPQHIDPYWVAGWLRGKPVPQTSALTQPIMIPADAEMIIEGVIDPTKPLPPAYLQGVDGFYHKITQLLPFHITAITHRNEAVFPVMSVHDFHWMNQAITRFYLPILKMLFDCIEDIYLPQCGAGRNLTIISIHKRTPGDAYRVLHGIWGLGELAYSRAVIIVDNNVNIQDQQEVWHVIQQQVDWHKDVTITNGITHPQDLIYPKGVGAKIGIDATHKVGRTIGMWDNAIRLTHDPTDQYRFPDDHLIILPPQVDINQPDLVWRYVLATVNWHNDLELDGNRIIIRAVFDLGRFE